MKCTLQPVTWVMRFHERDDAVVGDPYVASTTVTVDAIGTASLQGFAVQRYTPEAWRAAEACLSEAGVQQVMWTRIKDGRIRLVRVPITGTSRTESHES